MDIVGQVDEPVFDMANPTRQGRPDILALQFQRPGLNGHGCQPLGVIVVKFPGQTTQLLFLRGDETTGQSLQFLLVGIQGRLGPLALAQVPTSPTMSADCRSSRRPTPMK